ncbi:lantibiotic dehydratase C-terminal domain-containing protein [Vallicoccus soli]|uniref:Thiopeptide-type bacteriocin biosynthesis domain-containing protein n=1 Tax=Vallicoccus soli TaxID=2339232 RepID=A0A3A3ZAS9_9ACTN|nr:lantibiotic dehydratase C-terminal domain-containing protein [Vallicoccus soli]RJK98196.1 hypothetical protein D5H78_04675 [Vallicoccus soli]
MTATADQPAAVAAAPDPGAAWTAWHLHLASPARSLHDRVALGVVAPVVAALPGHPWFFLRFWQSGPHLRLRVRDLDAGTADAVEAELASRLVGVGALRPGEVPVDASAYADGAARLAAGERGRDATVRDLLPPGVHRTPYQPEVDRYGGPALLPDSEALFQTSSEAVLAYLASGRGGEPPVPRTALAARATAVAAAVLDGPGERADYYAHGVRAWREWALLSHPAEVVGAAVRVGADVPPVPDAPGPFAPWQRGLAGLVRRVRAETPYPPGGLLSSHVHMLHNRLGLTLLDELRTYAWLAATAGDRPAPPRG